MCLELLGKVYLQSKRQLIDIFRTCLKKMKLNVVFWSSKKVCNVFRFKDQIPIYMNSNIIYKCKCNTCNDVYIHKTKCHLAVRQYEHLGRSILTDSNYWNTMKKMLLPLESIAISKIIQLIPFAFPWLEMPQIIIISN